jgi:hypothetical protein
MERFVVPLVALLSMFIAALRSLRMDAPHGQSCHRSASDFFLAITPFRLFTGLSATFCATCEKRGDLSSGDKAVFWLETCGSLHDISLYIRGDCSRVFCIHEGIWSVLFVVFLSGIA